MNIDTPRHRSDILIVDDTPSDLKMLMDILREEGYRVRPAADGELALRSAQARLPELILLDITMPGLNGFEVCRRLKSEARTAAIPVLFISARYTVEDKIMAFRAGGLDFITKPFQAEEVLARIEIHLALRRIKLQLEEQNLLLKKEIEARKEVEHKLAEHGEQLEELVTRRTNELTKSCNRLENEIRERQKAQSALEKSEARLRAIFLAAEDISFILINISELPVRIIEFSPGAELLFGYRRDEILNESIDKLHAPEDMQKLSEIFARLRQGKRGFDGETMLIRSTGDSFPAFVSYTPIQSSFNGPVALGVAVDITARRDAQEKLRESEEKFRSLFNDALDMIHIINPSGNIVDANPIELQSLGYTREEFIGKPLSDIIHPDYKEHSQNALGQVLRGSTVKNHETALITKSADHIDVEVNAVPLIEDGEVIYARAIIRDITERKTLENRLRQAQKMEAIGTLSGGIAHDFNNILAPILGFAEMALESIPAGSQPANDIREVVKAAIRAKELVKQILSFSRQTEHELQPLRIQLVIKEALKLLRATIPATIEIRQDIKMECNPILADPTQIHQLIMNLCTNAYHAMRETGGVLGVSLTPIELDSEDLHTKINLHPGKYVQLEVSDTGHGMTQSVKERIFEPYFTTKGKGEGTGLGLSVVHAIIKSLNGDITVYSELGKGTSFRVYFPAIEQEAKKLTDKETNGPLPTGHERIMVVDDDEIIVQMEQQMLRSLGYEVTAFTDSEQSLKSLQSRPNDFDLIITDMTMPGITGDILAKQVLKIRPDLPIILCTGFSELITEDKAKAIGIKEFIMKPIIKRTFAETVRKVLDKQTS